MFRLLKFLFWCALIGGFIWFGMSVPLGKYTLFSHIKRIWNTQETRDLVDGTKEAAKPAADKVKRAFRAGVDEAKRNP
jgi:hypothetical protein